MVTLRKDILRESVEICRQSNLYDEFTREEKREAVIHVYHVILEYQSIGGRALEGNLWELPYLSLQA